MGIGNGIAIAGLWIMVGMLGLSQTVANSAFWAGVLIAIATTIYLK